MLCTASSLLGLPRATHRAKGTKRKSLNQTVLRKPYIACRTHRGRKTGQGEREVGRQLSADGNQRCVMNKERSALPPCRVRTCRAPEMTPLCLRDHLPSRCIYTSTAAAPLPVAPFLRLGRMGTEDFQPVSLGGTAHTGDSERCDPGTSNSQHSVEHAISMQESQFRCKSRMDLAFLQP